MRALLPGSRHWALATGVLALLLLQVHAPISSQTRDTLPASLSNREFWSLTEQLSEPDGFFRSNSGSPDNLLSNEGSISTVAAALATQVKPAGVYLGVGPEQNFTYIAAIKPRIAFVTDIRRGNLHVHLVYKSLFETHDNRADFVARLFSRTRPPGLTATSTAAELMSAYLRAAPVDETTFTSNLKAITDNLTRQRRGIPLEPDDLAGIEYVYRNYHRFGPAINYTSSINQRTGSSASYASLMAATDRATGTERTYLATEENFALVRDMQRKSLIVPVVGDFSGPKALRAIGAYLKKHGATVTAFYVSNVEMYLQRNNVWDKFCANVATMPLDESSIFIRPDNRSGSFSPMAYETSRCK